MGKSNTNWVHFTRTHWTVVLSAKDNASPERHQALASLCQSYWPPIYAYIRQKGHRPADAEDLTQEFFARLLENDYLKHLVHQNGKFRSFLLSCLNHMLSDERDRRRAQKRGGDLTHISMEDFANCEAEFAPEPLQGDLDNAFDRIWARTVLKRATQRLETDYVKQGKVELFQELKPFASGSGAQPPYEALAIKLGTTAEALRAAVHRMRGKFGRLIRHEVSQTISRPEELDDEIRHLIQVVSGM